MKRINFFVIAGVLGLITLSACQNPSDHGENTDKGPTMFSNRDRKASCVYLTEDQNHNPLTSWVEVDSTDKKYFYFSEFDAESDELDSPVSVPIEQNTSVHEEGMPKIAVKGDGSLLAIYETSESSKVSRWGLGDVRYIQSFDNGKTWTDSKSVAPKDYDNKQSSSFANLTRLDDGEIGITWLSTQENSEKRPLKFAKTEGKTGLTEPIEIDTQACECCRTAISSTDDGYVSIAYRDLLDGPIRDISIARSTDNGESFSTPNSFSNDQWEVDGCPHAGPSVTSHKGQSFVTWFTGSNKDEGVNYAQVDDSGNMDFKKHIDTDGHYIQLDLMPNKKPIMAYSKDYDKGDSIYSKIMVNRFKDDQLMEKEISLPKTHASYPVVQSVDNQHALVAWSNKGKVFYKLLDVNSINSAVGEIPHFAKN